MDKIYKTKWGQCIDLSTIISITPTDESLPIRSEIYCKHLDMPLKVLFPIRVKRGQSVDYNAHINIVKDQVNDLIEAWKEYNARKDPQFILSCDDKVGDSPIVISRNSDRDGLMRGVAAADIKTGQLIDYNIHNGHVNIRIDN